RLLFLRFVFLRLILLSLVLLRLLLLGRIGGRRRHVRDAGVDEILFQPHVDVNVRRRGIVHGGDELLALLGTGDEFVFLVRLETLDAEIALAIDGHVDRRVLLLGLVETDVADVGVAGRVVVGIADGAGKNAADFSLGDQIALEGWRLGSDAGLEERIAAAGELGGLFARGGAGDRRGTRTRRLAILFRQRGAAEPQAHAGQDHQPRRHA